MSEPQTTATTEAPAHQAAEPTAFGLTAPAWIALAMLVVIAVMIWKKVPAGIAGALDTKIALIRDQLAEAEEIVAKAKTDSEALIERRTRMAEDKIAAEERSAVEQLRAAAADAAARAAAKLIAERHDAASDAKLVDQSIGEIGR